MPADIPIWTIPPAVDVPAITPPLPPRRTGEPLRLLAIGRLRAVKGHEDALLAVAALKHRNIEVELRIVGDGDRFEALSLAVAQLGLGDIVALVGSVSPTEVAAHLEWAHAVVHPSLAEGFSNAVLEAQAAGRPVIASDAGGLRENVADGITGIVVARRSPEALSNAIERLASDHQLLGNLAAAGPGRVRQHFGLETHIDRWIDCYETLGRLRPPKPRRDRRR